MTAKTQTRLPICLFGPKIWSKSKYLFLVFFIILLFLFTLLIRSGKKNPVLLSPIVTLTHSSHNFNSEFYNQAYQAAPEFIKKPSGPVGGGILPHHLLASPLIAGYFSGLSGYSSKTVILIGPNHYDVGNGKILTSLADWKTNFGNLIHDEKNIATLIKSKIVSVDESVFENEHAIYGIVPFIKKTWPDTKIIPLILKSNVTQKEAEQLVLELEKIYEKGNTIIIASVDLSHYQTLSQAQKYDQESISAISAFSFDRIFSLDRVRNYDSPQSIFVVTRLMKDLGYDDPIIIKNSNSAILSKNPGVPETTSYLTMYFVHPSQNMMKLDSIFKYQDPSGNQKTDDSQISLFATGDVIPARSVNSQMVKRNDFSYPFRKTEELLNTADIVFINLESPLVKSCPVTVSGMVFCGDERTVEGLKYANVKVANLANNHLTNYGNDGIDNTIKLLERNNILVTGIKDKSAILTIKGKKFGFLGYNDIERNDKLKISLADPDRIATEVASLKKDTDYVIVTFHWGTEYTLNPTLRQRELAHIAIDNGADLIIGNHPHWVQGVEIYKNKFITYAHGNFVFDQMWSQETREGVVGKYVFGSNGLQDISYYPIIIEDYVQPRYATEKEAGKILKRMDESTKRILLDYQM